MIYQPFGKTGHKSSRALFGAAAFSTVTQEEANSVLPLLDQYGINHIDVAASYGDAELRLGPWMEKRRDDFFLASKTEERTRSGAWNELQRALERFPFESVLLPWNPSFASLPEYAQPFRELVELCRERGVAVQTIKSIARRLWENRPHTRNTWYEPLEEQEDIDLAVSWVMKQQDLFLNTAADIHLLPRVLEAIEKVQTAERAAGESALDDSWQVWMDENDIRRIFPNPEDE